MLLYGSLGSLQLRHNPAVDKGEVQQALRPAIACADIEAIVLAFAIHEYKAGRIPELIAEVAIALAAIQIKINVSAWGCQACKCKAQGIGAKGSNAFWVLRTGFLFNLGGLLGIHESAGALCDQRIQINAVNQINRIQGIALGFTHLLAFGITHQCMDIDMMKGHLACEMASHHHHARHPEKDDVKAGDQNTGG